MAFWLCLKMDQTGFNIGNDTSLITLCLRLGTLEAELQVGIQVYLSWWGSALGESKWEKQNETEGAAKQGFHPSWSGAMVWSQTAWINCTTELETGVQPLAQGEGHSPSIRHGLATPDKWWCNLQDEGLPCSKGQFSEEGPAVMLSQPSRVGTDKFTYYTGMNGDQQGPFGTAIQSHEAIEIPVIVWLPGNRMSNHY